VRTRRIPEPRLAETLAAGLPEVRWADASGLVEDLRLVKSPRELDYTRRAAALADAMVQAAMKTAGVGVNEREIAGYVKCYHRRCGGCSSSARRRAA
jgi:Xaa-Pro dipeptidase